MAIGEMCQLWLTWFDPPLGSARLAKFRHLWQLSTFVGKSVSNLSNVTDHSASRALANLGFTNGDTSPAGLQSAYKTVIKRMLAGKLPAYMLHSSKHMGHVHAPHKNKRVLEIAQATQPS